MPSKRIILLSASIVIAITTVLGFLWYRSIPSPSSRLQAEREIYEILIKRNTRMIGEFTLSWYDCTSSTCVNSLLEDFPQLQTQTIADFQEHNIQSYPLRDFLPDEMKNGFLDSINNQEMGRQISFSRIGFDPFLTQALVLVEDCRGDACFNDAGEFMYSMGSFVFLQKSRGRWHIQSETDIYLIERPSP